MTGTRAFRGHKPGSTFEARIERAAEERALGRGDIAVLDRSTPEIRPGSFVLPAGWESTHKET